jgi:hypothetical protein
VERAATKPAAAAESRSAPEAAPAAKSTASMKSAATVEPTTSVKSSTTVETTSASAAMGSTATMAAAAPSECRRGHTKKHERNNCNENYGCNENYRQGFLHFSPSDPITRDRRAGTNFRRGHLRWQPTYCSILHPFTLFTLSCEGSFEGPLPLAVIPNPVAVFANGGEGSAFSLILYSPLTTSSRKTPRLSLASKSELYERAKRRMAHPFKKPNAKGWGILCS